MKRALQSLLLGGVLIVFAGCGSTHSEVQPVQGAGMSIKRIGVVVAGAPAFTVSYSRSGNNGAGAAIGGLIGLAVETSVRSSQDSAREKVLGGRVGDTNCKSGFLDAFQRTLAGRSQIQATYFDDRTAVDPKLFDAVVVFDVLDCGFKLVDEEQRIMAAYVEMQAQMQRQADAKPIWDDRESILGGGRTAYSQLEQTETLARDAYRSAIEEAGQRMALKIVFM